MRSEHVTIGVMADVDAGKTTLSETILFKSGTIRRLGRVDHGDTCLDTDKMERERGITIYSRQAEFRIKDRKFTLLDTPGHADFSAETERVLSVLDYAVLLISGPEGVRSHVETIWKMLTRYRIPVFVFVNKMDLNVPGEDSITASLGRAFGSGFVNSKLLESEETAVLDDALTEKYISGGAVTDSDIAMLIEKRKLFPCYFGSALKDAGIEELMQALYRYTLEKEYPDEFSARIFKITREKNDRLSHMKLTGGILEVKDSVGEDKIEQIRICSGESCQTVRQAYAGMTVAVTGLSHSYAGQGIGKEKDSEIPMLVPLFSMTVIPPFDVSNAELYEKLKQLEEEIPEISVDPFSGKQDVRIRLMGPVQTEVIETIMRERYGMPVRFENNRIVYRETVSEVSEGVGHFEPLRHYAEVHLKLEPGETGSGITYQSELSEDLLPGNYQRLILSQLESKRHRGILTGSFLTDVKITLIAGKHHVKHTVGGDFREAACRAVRHGLMKNRCILLEPWYSFVITLPQEYSGRAMSDLSCRLYADLEGTETSGNETVIRGKAPVSVIQNYPSELTAYTKGYGRITLLFSGYYPAHDPEAVITEECYDPEADLHNPCGSVFCEHGAGQYVSWDKVEEWMHIPYVLVNEKNGTGSHEPESTSQPAGRDRKTSPNNSPVSDRELEQIFLSSLGKNRKVKEDFPGRKPVKQLLKTPEHVTVPEPKKEFLLVDGYNIIHAWEELKDLCRSDLNSARTALLEILSDYQGFRGMTLIVVFDAYKVPGGKGSIERYHELYTVYTKESETADAFIEKTVHEIGKKHNVTVATSDALEQIIVFGDGAVRMSAAELKKEIGNCRTDIEEICRRNATRLENRIPVPSEKQDEKHAFL